MPATSERTATRSSLRTSPRCNTSSPRRTTFPFCVLQSLTKIVRRNETAFTEYFPEPLLLHARTLFPPVRRRYWVIKRKGVLPLFYTTAA